MQPGKIEIYIDQTMTAIVHFLPSLISAVLFLVIGWWLIGRTDRLISAAMRKRVRGCSRKKELREK